MNTSATVIDLLTQALATTNQAGRTVGDLVVDHEYQDVAALVIQAAAALLQSASLLMQSEAEAAFDQMETAEDLLDSVYTIIDGELDEE